MNALSLVNAQPFNTQPFQKLENLYNYLTQDGRHLYGNDETYPPYNAWFDENGNCNIEIAVAGFNKDELSIEFDGKSLFVKGEKAKESEEQSENRKWIKHSLARRSFVRRWEIRGAYLLETASLKNGILTVILKDDTKRVSVTIQEE